MLNALILLIFLSVTVLAIRNIMLGFTLIFAIRLLLPAVVRVPLGLKDLSLNSCLTLVLIGVFSYHLIIRKMQPAKLPGEFLKGCIVFVLGMLFLSIIAPELTVKSRVGALIQMFYTEFTLCIIGWYLVKDNFDVKKFSNVIFCATLLMCIYGCYCYVSKSNPVLSFVNVVYGKDDAMTDRFIEEDRAGLQGRVMGTMMHPLTWGGSCVLLFFFYLRRRNLKIWQHTTVLALLFVNVIFSGSRSALLAVIIGIGYLVISGSVKVKLNFIKYAVIVAVVLFVGIYQVPSLERYQGFIESTLFFWDSSLQVNREISGSSMSLRYRQLLGSIDMISNSPVVGLGFGYTKFYNFQFGFHPVLMGFESLLFLSLIETGFLGLSLWIFFFFALFLLIKKINRFYKIRLSTQLSGYTITKAFIVAYFLFCMFTGVQSTLYLFLVLYMVQAKELVFEGYNKVEDNNKRKYGTNS